MLSLAVRRAVIELKPSAWSGGLRALPGSWNGWSRCDYTCSSDDRAKKRKAEVSYAGRFVGTDLGVVDLSVAGVNDFLWNNVRRILFKVGDLGHAGGKPRPGSSKKVQGRRYLSLPKNGHRRRNAVLAARQAGLTLASATVVTPGHLAVRSGKPVVDVYSTLTGYTVRLRAATVAEKETFETIIPGKTTAVKRHEAGMSYRPIIDMKPAPK